MASSSNTEEGSQHSLPREKKKKVRGICKMKLVTQSRKAGIKLQIGWNSRGQPINPNKSTFSYFVGWITRSTVPIIYSNWGRVPADLKNRIWEEVQESFEVTEEHKNFVLALASRDARAFRSRLRKKYLMDDDGNLILQPPEKYVRLNTVADYWVEFVNQSSTEDFKKESKENAERARRITLRYRRSAKGYAQLEQDMIASLGSDVTCMPRHAVWKAARVNKKGVIDDEEVQRVVDECENLKQTVPNEQLQTMGKDDILSKALGVPEHPGRVRAAGFGASQKSIFGSSQSTPHPSWTEWQQKVQQWMTQMTQWVAHVSGGQVPPFMTMPGQPPFIPVPGQPPFSPVVAQTVPHMPILGQSHPHAMGPPQSQLDIPPQSKSCSCTPITSLEIPEGEHPCLLFLNYPHRLVARGTVYNKEGGVTLHTMSLPPDYHKVSVDIVQPQEEESPLPVPIEDGNLVTLQDAIGTYVAWPKSLINLAPQIPPPSSKEKGKGPCHTKESITSPVKGFVHRIIPEEFADAQDILYFDTLRVMIQGDRHVELVNITYSSDYWGKEFEDSIGKDEIKEVIHHKMLSASSLCFYISYLCEACLRDTNYASKFSFISPFELQEKGISHKRIVDDLKHHAGQDHLILVPYNVGLHWVLIAINTSDETLYYMDPLCQHYSKRTVMHKLFNNAMITYRMDRAVQVGRTKMNQTSWVNVDCPKQMDAIDCGYYVGLFIMDILQHGQTRIPTDYLPKSRCPTLPRSRIQQFKMGWCAYLYPKFMEAQLSTIDY